MTSTTSTTSRTGTTGTATTVCVLCGNRRDGEVSVRPRPLPSAAMRQAARDLGRRDYTEAAVCDDVHACIGRWPASGPLG